MDKEVRQIKFDTGDNKSREYEVEAIQNSALYAKESELVDLSRLLSSLIEKIFRGRKYLGASVSDLAPQKAHQLFP